MESLASLTITLGLFLGPIYEIAQNYYISPLAEFLISSLMCAFFYDSFFRLIPSGSKPGQFRGIMGTGLCYVFLLPLALSCNYRSSTQPEFLKLSLLLIFIPVISQLAFTALYSNCNLSMRVLLCISIIPWIGLTVFCFSHYIHNIHHTLAARMSIASADFVLLGLGIISQYLIYSYASDSFSLQEGTIISQALVIFAHQTWMPLCTALWNYTITKDIHIIDHLLEFYIPKIELFSEVAVTSGFIVLCLIIFCKPFQNSWGFYGLTFSTMGLVSYPILYLAFRQDFVTWMYDYVKATSERRKLFVLWALVCLISIITVAITIRNNGPDIEQQEGNGGEQEVRGDVRSKISDHDKHGIEGHLRHRCGDFVKQESKVQQCNKNMSKSPSNSGITTVTRKVFHIIAVSAFLPGLHYDVTILNCACCSALVIFTFLECMRILKVWPVGSILHLYLNMFRDKQDQGAFILTPIYLLVGFSVPIWLQQESGANSALFSGVLSLGIGDAAASYVGSKYGRRKWPSGSKTVEGTLASMSAMLLFGALLHYSGINVTFHLFKLAFACVLTSLLEAFTTQIDNLILPLFMYCLLLY